MKIGQWWRRVRVAWGQRRAWRRLCTNLQHHRPLHLLELTLSDLSRTQLLLQQALQAAAGEIHYTLVDLFDLRRNEPMALKEVFAQLQRPGVQVHLVPGPCNQALRRLALQGIQVQWVLINFTPEEQLAWENLLPPLLAPGAQVWVEHHCESKGVHFLPWQPDQTVQTQAA